MGREPRNKKLAETTGSSKKQVAKKARLQQAAPKKAAVKKQVAKKARLQQAAPKKAAVKKQVAKKARLQQAAPKKAVGSKRSKTRENLKPKQWIEAFVRGIIVLQLQDFFRWCWKNLDRKQERETVAALYRAIFFPFESMPEYERLPIWKHAKAVRHVGSITAKSASLVQRIAVRWAEETGQNIDNVG